MQSTDETCCNAPGARLWPYRVAFPIGKPMTGKIRAVDRHHARRLLLNRHPEATVRVLPLRYR